MVVLQGLVDAAQGVHGIVVGAVLEHVDGFSAAGAGAQLDHPVVDGRRDELQLDIGILLFEGFENLVFKFAIILIIECGQHEGELLAFFGLQLRSLVLSARFPAGGGAAVAGGDREGQQGRKGDGR